MVFVLCLPGCDNLGWDKTGYEITIYPGIIKYDQVVTVEAFLSKKGFQTYRREMPDGFSKIPNMVQTNYTKMISENPYDFIQIAIRYSKELDGNVNNVTIYLENRYIGTISKKIKAELTSLYDSFYHEFGNSLGPIRVEMKEVAPPVSISNDIKQRNAPKD
jgi:hypothetical protein